MEHSRSLAAHTSLKSASVVLTNLGKLLPDLEPLYKDIHAHPELSMHETRTAGIGRQRTLSSSCKTWLASSAWSDASSRGYDVLPPSLHSRGHLLRARGCGAAGDTYFTPSASVCSRA